METLLLWMAFWSALAGVFVSLIFLQRQRQITGRLRRRIASLERTGNERDEELRRLVTTRLPALADAMYGHPIEVPGMLHPQLRGTSFGRHMDALMNSFTESMKRTQERADQSAKATLKSMMRTVQSLANEQQLVISQMQDRYDNPDVLEGLMRIDHMNGQLARRAQATAVLFGSWPGQQRSAAPLIDVVRGATSRIRDYRRVEANAQINAAVISRAVEPVVLAIAELLDNGARHSQPDTAVEVSFRSVHNGIAIVIDDAGVAMDAEGIQQATRLLSGRESVDINRLGDPPQIGFAVVGVLCARYGFSVSVDTRSPYGGVRAVVFLPTALLTRPETTNELSDTSPQTVSVRREAPERPTTQGGLPRRRRAAVAETADVSDRPGTADRQAPAAPGRPARQVAAGFGAWQRGTRSGRASSQPDHEGRPQP